MTTARLAKITRLDSGGHEPTDGEMCLLEAVAYVAGEPFSDNPACTSPVLATFGRNLNDVLPEVTRQELIPFIPRLIGTAGDGQDETRSYLALDWLIRVYTPAWLDLAGISDAAAELRALGRIVDMVSAERARPIVRAGQDKAAAAWDAAWAAAGDAAGDAARDAARDAAWDAARDAAWDAAWDAARDAAGDAAGDAAWDAAWDAARAAARDAARDAAWDAARDAAGDAAGDAARDAAWDAARDAAWDAAWDALKPTVEQLQRSAIDLFTRMINPADDAVQEGPAA